MSSKFELRRKRRSTGFRNRFKEFLNTPLGLWTLSSIFIGGISFSYSQYDSYNSRKKESESRVAVLQLEVLQRVEQYNAYKSLIQSSPEDVPSAMNLGNKREAQYRVALSNLVSAPGYQEDNGYRKPITAANPEFRNRTLASLIGELRTREIQRKSKVLPSLEAVVSLNPDFVSHLPPDEASERVKTAFSTEYWKTAKGGESAP